MPQIIFYLLINLIDLLIEIKCLQCVVSQGFWCENLAKWSWELFLILYFLPQNMQNKKDHFKNGMVCS